MQENTPFASNLKIANNNNNNDYANWRENNDILVTSCCRKQGS